MGPSKQQGNGIGTLLPNQSEVATPSTTPRYLSGVESDDGYFQMLMDDLYDKMKAGSQDSNVIIPETGAAKYWYVDPRAGNQPFDPTGGQSSTGGQFNPMDYAEQSHDLPNDPQSEAINALGRSRNNNGDSSRKSPVNWGTMDQRNSAYKTTIMDIGNEQWEVPVPEEFASQTKGPPSQWPQKVMDILEDRARDLLEQGYDPFGDPLKSF